MKLFKAFSVLMIVVLAACTLQLPTVHPSTTITPGGPTYSATATYTDPTQPVEARVQDLLARMSLDEKIGQMTQGGVGSLKPGDVTTYLLGSVLSGGDDHPQPNNPQAWSDLVKGLQTEAMATPLRIPIIYGIDATHGNAHLYGATIYPQEIGLAATHDPQLVRQIGAATAEEILAAGVPWTFAPLVAVPQDIRWGRTYESFSEDTQLTTEMGTALLQGLQTLPAGYQAAPDQTIFTLATPKHYIGDGGTVWGSSRTGTYKLDQGNTQMDEATLRKLFLPPYKAAVDSGAMSVMVSYSSWNGTKMHGQKYLVTTVLKDELGFKGFVVSDWEGINQVDPDYYTAVVKSINAGVDMAMAPGDYMTFISTLKDAVNKGDVSMDRINDAVTRILRVKFELGLFEHPYPDATYLGSIRSDAHIQLARQAVRESLVLLKNDNSALPIAKNTSKIFVAGQGADDIGMQSGGWTLTWQGQTGNITLGSTIISAIRSAVSDGSEVDYDQYARFTGHAPVGIVVVGEQPYAEGVGDTKDLTLSLGDIKAIKTMRPLVDKLIVILLSGRPMVITDQFGMADAWVAAWLPGSEGEGITDDLFGDYPFTGKLPYTWPRNNDQLPINENNSTTLTGCEAPLFPFGYGLGKDGSQPIVQPSCD